MKIHHQLSIVLLLSLIASIVQAAHMPVAYFTADLRYNNKPIDPLCFFNLGATDNKINLKNCGITQAGYTITGDNLPLTKDGFYGFNYKNPQSSSSASGFSYYKVLDAGNHYYWIYTANNSGGSGDFTGIYLFFRNNEDTATLTKIAGGDRCNGGISHIEQTNYDLEYSVNMTPFDFLTMANYNHFNLKPYEDLAGCATCCAAKVHYIIDRDLQPRFQRVELDKNINAEALSTQGKQQACFNKLYGNFQRIGLTDLNEKGLHRFADEFHYLCLGW
jgi:hypothetical protein